MRQTEPFYELKEILHTLTGKEAHVIIARFGIGDQEVQTLEVVGQVLGVTRERIRQIEATALRKLRKKAQLLDAKREDYLG